LDSQKTNFTKSNNIQFDKKQQQLQQKYTLKTQNKIQFDYLFEKKPKQTKNTMDLEIHFKFVCKYHSSNNKHSVCRSPVYANGAIYRILPSRLLLPLGADCVPEKQWIIGKFM